jgi:hypothetical protein
MNRVSRGIAGVLFGITLAAFNSGAQTTTFKGEITDEKLICINTPLKPTDYSRLGCVLNQAHYVNPPSKYALYNEASKTTYRLDDQRMAEPYIAAKVIVTGTLDAATKTIKVKEIKVDESAYKSAGR